MSQPLKLALGASNFFSQDVKFLCGLMLLCVIFVFFNCPSYFIFFPFYYLNFPFILAVKGRFRAHLAELRMLSSGVTPDRAWGNVGSSENLTEVDHLQGK